MKLSRIMSLSLVAVTMALTTPTAVSAQDAESIYMRRPLPLSPATSTQGFRWETTSTVTDLNGNPVDESNYCGPVERRNRSICVSEQTGQQVATSYCGSTSRPPEVEQAYVGTACSFDWVVGAWNEGAATCTPNETQTRSVTCQNQQGAVVADGFCDDPKPQTLRQTADYSGCTGTSPESTPTVKWGAWVYDQYCSATATKTRNGTCLVGNKDAPASVCTDAGVALRETVQEANFTRCSTAWQSDEWSSYSSTCGTGTRTREVYCLRSDGTRIPDSSCTANMKPVTSETKEVTSGCETTQCYGSEQILTTENVMQDCNNFAANFPKCPAGATQGDPGTGTCVTSVVSFSGDNCAVKGFEATEASCGSSGNGGTTTGRGCIDECGEQRLDGMKWCTAGTTNLGMRTSRCTNGTIGYESTISGVGCDAGARRYECP